MLIVAGLSLRNLEPRVWDANSPYHLPSLRAVMVSYGEFHQRAVCRRMAMKDGLRKYLGAPEHVRIFLDNGAFYFLRNKGEADQRGYREFVRRARPDWYPVRFDAIPTPQMAPHEQRACFERTMQLNRAYHQDGYVPIIHVSRLLTEYIEALRSSTRLLGKDRLALGGIVPNLLRSRKAMGYDEILESLRRVRDEFPKTHLHVFGIGGTATLHLAALLGVNSVDSSGWRNRAARGIVQLPGSGDRTTASLGNWRGRTPSEDEWKKLAKCRCPACLRFGTEGLKGDGLTGFCNRATHNLHILLEEAKWLDLRNQARTYTRCYRRRLNNSTYFPLVEALLQVTTRPRRNDDACKGGPLVLR
jgi:7-cyano-7-deazaguanine tRNA-ribosyltransferase